MNSDVANSSSSTLRPCPPRLHFDDGRRIFVGEEEEELTENKSSRSIIQGNYCTTLKEPRLRNGVELDTYYEIQSTCQSIVEGLQLVNKVKTNFGHQGVTDAGCGLVIENDFLCRIALQFPDDLLPDAAEVCWQMEETIGTIVSNGLLQTELVMTIPVPLIFILGDTTFGSCCVDTVAAQHLRADWIVHFGKACLTSPSRLTPISYVFGRAELNVNRCIHYIYNELVQCESQHNNNNTKNNSSDSHQHTHRLIVLYDTIYSHAINDLTLRLREALPKNSKVVQGIIPNSARKTFTTTASNNHTTYQDHDCICKGKDNPEFVRNPMCNCEINAPIESSMSDNCPFPDSTNEHSLCNETTDDIVHLRNSLVIGGLHIQLDPDESIQDYSLVYIGGSANKDEEDDAHLTNILLRCSSVGNANTPKDLWIYNPPLQRFVTTEEAVALSKRQIQQRYYQIQKAKVAQIFGIVVASVTIDLYRPVIAAIEQMLTGRFSYYTFAVGKINVSKLTNFSEVDCFVLIACPDLLLSSHNPKEYPTPIITPFELAIALGYKEWDGFYSLELSDFLSFRQRDVQIISAAPRIHAYKSADITTDGATCDQDNNILPLHGSLEHTQQDSQEDTEEDDTPMFDITTGRLVCLKQLQREKNDTFSSHYDDEVASSLLLLPGQGQITEYSSAAADVWKKREYKGLQSKIGQTEVISALPGQFGIASEYREQQRPR
jgi:diphthamide biosynthesis protein 2